jgi:hypothetical protein
VALLSNSIRAHSELPDWFDLKNYKFLSDLDSAGWYEQLFAREQLFLLIKLRSDKSKMPDESSLSFKMAREIWSSAKVSFKNSEVLSAACGYDGANSRVSSSYSRSVHSLTYREYLQEGDKIKDEQKLNADLWWENIKSDRLDVADPAIRLSRKVMGFIDSPLYISQKFTATRAVAEIDLTMPDAMLVASFKTWLSDTRADFCLAAPTQYRRLDFASWCRVGVLPYIDLTSWAELSGRKIPNRVMANTIFPTGEGGEETIRKTTAPLALEMIGRGEYSDRTILDTLLAVAALDGGVVEVG